MINDSSDTNWQDQYEKALKHMDLALSILDHTEGSIDVGVHLDLAICRLREALEESKKIIQLNAYPSGSAQAICA